MKLFFADTIWKRQMRSLMETALVLASGFLLLGIIATIFDRAARIGLLESSFFQDYCKSFLGVALMIQALISGILLGSEEEENQTHSFVFRLPISRVRWVSERLVAIVLSLMIYFALLMSITILVGYLNHTRTLYSAIINVLSQIFTLRIVLSAFANFCICACVASIVKKVLPAAVTSLIVILIIIVTLILISHQMPDLKRIHYYPSIFFSTFQMTCYFTITPLVAIGLFALSISKREGE
jgi:ABC-type transport system involved in multi-copper enzyme maturation permease subunit